jgi:hypothetical protein
VQDANKNNNNCIFQNLFWHSFDAAFILESIFFKNLNMPELLK